jgi:hypothetical protein
MLRRQTTLLVWRFSHVQQLRVVGSWVAEGDDTTLSLANVKLNRNQVVGVSATNAAGTGPEAYAYP